MSYFDEDDNECCDTCDLYVGECECEDTEMSNEASVYRYEEMRIVLHGGMCCGIKQIYGLEYHATSKEAAKPETAKMMYEGGATMTSTDNWYWPAAPAESKEARLDRYLAFLDEHRPRGICEIVLSALQLTIWQQKLIDRGFVRVSECHNSNSGSKIYVFHRIKDK